MAVGRAGRRGPDMAAMKAARGIAFAAPGGGAGAPAARLPARARRLAGR